MSLLGTLTLSNPLTYFILFVIAMIVISVQVLSEANRVLKEEGVVVEKGALGASVSRMLKWSSAHETKVGIVIFLVLAAGVILAVNF